MEWVKTLLLPALEKPIDLYNPGTSDAYFIQQFYKKYGKWQVEPFNSWNEFEIYEPNFFHRKGYPYTIEIESNTKAKLIPFENKLSILVCIIKLKILRELGSINIRIILKPNLLGVQMVR